MDNTNEINTTKLIIIDIVKNMEDEDPRLYELLGFALSCASCDSKN